MKACGANAVVLEYPAVRGRLGVLPVVAESLTAECLRAEWYNRSPNRAAADGVWEGVQESERDGTSACGIGW